MRIIGVIALMTIPALTLAEEKITFDSETVCTRFSNETGVCLDWKRTGEIKSTKDDDKTLILEAETKCVETNQDGYCQSWSRKGTLKEKENDDDGTKCFPETSQVMTPKGRKFMNQLQVNDQVLAYDSDEGQVEFSPIRAWLDRDVLANSNFLKLETSRGQIEISSEHNIWLNDKYQFAKNAKVGDQLYDLDGDRINITEIKQVSQRGIYAPLTNLNNIFVSSENSSEFVLAHCFASVEEPEIYESTLQSLLDNYPSFNQNEQHPLIKKLESWWFGNKSRSLRRGGSSTGGRGGSSTGGGGMTMQMVMLASLAQATKDPDKAFPLIEALTNDLVN